MIGRTSYDSILSDPIYSINWVLMDSLFCYKVNSLLIQMSLLFTFLCLIKSFISCKEILRYFMNKKCTCICNRTKMSIIKRIYINTKDRTFNICCWQRLKFNFIFIRNRKCTNSNFLINSSRNQKVIILLFSW